jgi:excisionase family DNA binding protein
MSIEDLSGLEPAIASASEPATVAALIGELARLQALAQARMSVLALPAAPANDEARLLTMPEVAERLGITEDLARGMGRRGELPTVTVGERQVRVRTGALSRWVADRERGNLSRGRRG